MESVKCLRQSMAPKNGYRSDQFFRGGHLQYPPWVAAATIQSKRQMEISALPPSKKRKRGTETTPEEGTIGATEIVYAETVYVWKTLPVMHILPELKEFYPSVIVN